MTENQDWLSSQWGPSPTLARWRTWVLMAVSAGSSAQPAQAKCSSLPSFSASAQLTCRCRFGGADQAGVEHVPDGAQPRAPPPRRGPCSLAADGTIPTSDSETPGQQSLPPLSLPSGPGATETIAAAVSGGVSRVMGRKRRRSSPWPPHHR